MLGIAKVDQCVQAGHGFENDVSALAAVAAVWSAIFDVFFTPKADGTRAAATGTDENLGLVEKMHERSLSGADGNVALIPPASYCEATGMRDIIGHNGHWWSRGGSNP